MSAAPARAVEKLEGGDLLKMTKVIQQAGHPCRRASRGYFIEKDSRGATFRIFCDANRFNYRVFVTRENALIIEPWGQ